MKFCTFQNNFITGLCTIDPEFSLQLRGELLFKAELTLNLLQNLCKNSKVSSHIFLHGTFNFTKTPLGPHGTHVLVYRTNNKHKVHKDGIFVMIIVSKFDHLIKMIKTKMF